MVFINEWLPNPIGADATGEFVELYNSGDASMGLGGWTLATENNKKFSLAGRNVPAHGYLLLKRSITKLSLRNTDGGLSLYGPGGAIVDRADFLGAAPEGQSFSRANHASLGMGGAQHFSFADPTPGAANKTAAAAVAVRHYPFNVPLNPALNSSGFFAIMMGTAVLIPALIIYAIKTNEDLSELFFKGDEGVRRAAGGADRERRG